MIWNSFSPKRVHDFIPSALRKLMSYIASDLTQIMRLTHYHYSSWSFLSSSIQSGAAPVGVFLMRNLGKGLLGKWAVFTKSHLPSF